MREIVTMHKLEPKSEIRFAWGMSYDYHGQVLHGLNRYHAMIGMEIPDLTFMDYYHPIQFDKDFCKQFDLKETQVLYATCSNTWPAYGTSLDKIKEYQDHIHLVYNSRLPAILKGFKLSDVMKKTPPYKPSHSNVLGELKWPETIETEQVTDSTKDSETATTVSRTTTPRRTRSLTRIVRTNANFQRRRQKEQEREKTKIWTSTAIGYRQKRWVSDLISLGIQGISALMAHKKQNRLEKGMRKIVEKQAFMGKKIITLEKDMMSISRATFKDLKLIKADISSLSRSIRKIDRQIKQITLQLRSQSIRINDNTHSITFLSGMIALLNSKMERYLGAYRRIVHRLDHLITALENLSGSVMTQEVIPAEELEEMLKHIKERVATQYEGYELVLNDVFEYYNVPIASYSYREGVIGVQFPIFIKPKLQESLYLYQVRSIPVPYHINSDMIDETESPYTYTQINPTTQLVAMSSDTYISLHQSQLDQCLKISVVYFCEQLMLIKHNSEHTCESAIYHEQPFNVIKAKCNIKYYPHLEPEPKLLDAGDHLLLGNLPAPWSVTCNHHDQIPNPLPHNPYAIIKKSDLCQCYLTAGKWYVEGNIAYCEDNFDTNVQLYYTINMAVMMYQFRKVLEQESFNDSSLFKSPPPYDPIEPEIVIKTDEDILHNPPSPLVLDAAMEDLEKKRYATKQDYVMAMSEIDSWFSEDNKIHGFLLTACILIVFLLPVIGYVLVRHFGFKMQMFKMNSSLTKLLVAGGFLPPANSQECEETIRTMSRLEMTEIASQIVGAMIVMYLLYRSIRFLYHYLNMVNLGAVQNKETISNFLLYDKTDIYIQFTKNYGAFTLSLYIGTLFGNPENLIMTGNLKSITLEQNYVYDFIHIEWNNSQIILHEIPLQMPSTLPLFWPKKWIFRSIHKSNQGTFKILAYNPSSLKVTSLTKYKLIHPNAPVFETSGITMPESAELFEHEPEPPNSYTRRGPESLLGDTNLFD